MCDRELHRHHRDVDHGDLVWVRRELVMILDGNARLTPLTVLREAVQIMRDGLDPDAPDELEEALLGVLEETLQIKEWEADDPPRRWESRSRWCTCGQCTSAVRLAQAIIKEYEK